MQAADALYLSRIGELGRLRPTFDTYRKFPFDTISATRSTAKESEPPTIARDSEGKVDILFLNNAARSAYDVWVKGCDLSSGTIS